MSVADASAALGVTGRQVERLAQAGDIVITRRIGRALMLDSASVHRCAQMSRYRGRPWSEHSAWGALTLLSGLEVDWLPAAHRTRLRNRMVRSTPDEIAHLARRRQSRILRMRGWGGDMTGPGSALIAGGVSALEANRQWADRFGLTTGHHDGTDGYIPAAHLEALVDEFGLVPNLEGEVTVRIISQIPPALAGDVVPIAVAAVDLMESLNTRERSAGARVLRELLDDLR